MPELGQNHPVGGDKGTSEEIVGRQVRRGLDNYMGKLRRREMEEDAQDAPNASLLPGGQRTPR